MGMVVGARKGKKVAPWVMAGGRSTCMLMNDTRKKKALDTNNDWKKKAELPLDVDPVV